MIWMKGCSSLSPMVNRKLCRGLVRKFEVKVLSPKKVFVLFANEPQFVVVFSPPRVSLLLRSQGIDVKKDW